MQFPRSHPTIRARHALAVAVVFAQVVAATGAPVFVPRSAKKGAIPFPCQNHPCGCTTTEQGWAGDCCCFTLEQKLAWADERGIEPPAHVRPMVAERKAQKAKSACCAKHETQSCCDTAPEPPAPKLKWVAGVFSQKCRGDAAGLLKAEVSFPPTPASEVRASLPVCGRVMAFASHVVRASYRPPVPPPRVS